MFGHYNIFRVYLHQLTGDLPIFFLSSTVLFLLMTSQRDGDNSETCFSFKPSRQESTIKQ